MSQPNCNPNLKGRVMDENPFKPPAQSARLIRVNSRSVGSVVVWNCVILLAVIASIASFQFDLIHYGHTSWITNVAVGAFGLCPPLALFMVIAHGEMAVQRSAVQKSGSAKALYRAFKFCLSCICFLIVGYVLFVPSCVGAVDEASSPEVPLNVGA